MPAFTYKAVQGNGATIEGRIDAGGRQDAARMIEERGLTPAQGLCPTAYEGRGW